MDIKDIEVEYTEVRTCTCEFPKPRFINNNNLDNSCLNCGKPL